MNGMEELDVNWFLLLLVFSVCVLVRILQHLSTPFCDKVTGVVVSREPEELLEVRRDVSSLKEHLQQISITDSFAEHARVQRRLKQRESQLHTLEKDHRKQTASVNLIGRTVCSVLIQLIRVSVVVANRSTPVLVTTPASLWPLTAPLSFPTGIPGAVGCPLWGVMCIQTIDVATYLWRKKT